MSKNDPNWTVLLCAVHSGTDNHQFHVWGLSISLKWNFFYLANCFRTLVEEPEEIPNEPKNENYLSEIAFEDLTYADHEYNSYARPFHEDIPELEHFFGRDETGSFHGLYYIIYI